MESDDASTATVCVAVRMRPISQKEINEGGETCVEVVAKEGKVILKRADHPPKPFEFDHAFGSESSQPQVFRALGLPLLDKSFEGYNATIFAYGQTGSGKTHTMMSDRNNKDDRGLIPRIADTLFERIYRLSSDSRKFLVCCSFLEIYNEIVYDLLVPRGRATPHAGLEIREGKGMGVYVKDLQEIVVDSAEKLNRLIDQGFEHRATAATQMNATSSRSHCIFTIKLHQKDDKISSNNNFSKMNLVDLAGSERASRTGAQGDTLKEGANINKSLSALGNVINTLSSMAGGGKKVFIPYRNSKLTRVLQESLGGNALTTMMAAISPSKTNCEETLSTLNYAARAKFIKLNASKNEEAEHLSKLEEEVEMLRAKLAEAEQAKIHIDTSRYTDQIEEMERFMKQTWEDKERDTQKHEEQRRALELEAQKIRERANAEQRRRLKLLEDNCDLELTLQELMSVEGGEAFNTWPAQIAAVLEKEQRVAAQCRAVAVCKDAAMHDVDTWMERMGKGDEEDSAGDRMLLHQAERKVASMLRELEVLAQEERQLESTLATFLPLVRREAARTSQVEEDSEDAKAESGKTNPQERSQILSLMVRQLDAHRATVWGKIAEDHRNLGHCLEKLQGFLQTSQLGDRGAKLLEETAAELAGEKSGPGAESCAARAAPLGLASGALTDEQVQVSSNHEALGCARLLGGVQKASCAFGGWTPNSDQKGEFLQVDLGTPVALAGLAVQGRAPASGAWEQTGPLLDRLLDPNDPVPPARLFKRPPVRLIHDIFILTHARHGALEGGRPDFTPAQLDYDQLAKADRQDKVDFFELLLVRLRQALKALGSSVPALQLSPSDILGGKNTAESNRMLQLLCYLALRKKLDTESAAGIFKLEDQWITKFTISCSHDGKHWSPFTCAGDSDKPKVRLFEGPENASQVRYHSLWAPAQKPCRLLRLTPVEWQVHPGLRLEVYGFTEDASQLAPALSDGGCRLDVVRRQTGLMQRCLSAASAAALDRWHKAQKAEEERSQQALAAKSQVEQQLQDALKQLKKLRKENQDMEQRMSESEQRLVDSEAEKLRLQVERERADVQAKSLEEKLSASAEGHSGANVRIKELEDKQEETQSTVEDLQQQLAVLTEERDVARAREEELFELINEKEEQLMDTNQGYVNLTDQLNDLREELEEKIDEQAQMLDTLGERNQALMDQGLKLREELSESKRKLAEAETLARVRGQSNEAMPNLLQRMGSEALLKGVPSDETDGTDG